MLYRFGAENRRKRELSMMTRAEPEKNLFNPPNHSECSVFARVRVGVLPADNCSPIKSKGQ
jgi:hypothetical protein